MARAIDNEAAYRFLSEQLVKETGAFSKGVNKGLNIARSAMRNPDAIPTLTPPNEWVSVDERLPEYNPGTGAKSYWVAKKDSAGNWQMKIAQYCDYGYAMTVDAETEVTWRDWDFTKIANVTHWMLLPAPPAKEG
ncbi:DUF551 domain-containing protein [uncultured Oscillibacter sp.]|uniref:DUF551 domain-containing protein n=1 Tax=uncultured Oscillibacter sp. TaxID=876091 RepID=UPI00260B170B|nr:DUF551 domain-containing protein [uncultured Oscillibacter sp.]